MGKYGAAVPGGFGPQVMKWKTWFQTWLMSTNSFLSLSLLLNRPAARQDGKKKKEKKKSLWCRKDNEWRRWDDNRRRKLPATALLLHTSVTSLLLALYLKKITNGSDGIVFLNQKDKTNGSRAGFFELASGSRLIGIGLRNTGKRKAPLNLYITEVSFVCALLGSWIGFSPALWLVGKHSKKDPSLGAASTKKSPLSTSFPKHSYTIIHSIDHREKYGQNSWTSRVRKKG